MPDESPARVLIVDDHPIFRAGLRGIVESEPGLTVCGEASSVDEALHALEGLAPDLVVLDLSLPGKSGLELLPATKRASVAVLVLSSHDPLLYARRCLGEGARGYLEKKDAPDQVVQACLTVLSGEVYLGPRIATTLVDGSTSSGGAGELGSLTSRELNVLELFGRGTKPKQIAEQLEIRAKTVDAHLANIKKKLGLRDFRDLLRTATAWTEGLDRSDG